MANDNIYIYEHSTGEYIVRELTDEEQSIRDAEVEANLKKQKTAEKAKIDEYNLKVAAYQKLGLTDEEIAALVPALPESIDRA